MLGEQPSAVGKLPNDVEEQPIDKKGPPNYVGRVSANVVGPPVDVVGPTVDVEIAC